MWCQGAKRVSETLGLLWDGASGRTGEPWGGAAVGLRVLSRGREALLTWVLDTCPALKADAGL